MQLPDEKNMMIAVLSFGAVGLAAAKIGSSCLAEETPTKAAEKKHAEARRKKSTKKVASSSSQQCTGVVDEKGTALQLLASELQFNRAFLPGAIMWSFAALEYVAQFVQWVWKKLLRTAEQASPGATSVMDSDSCGAMADSVAQLKSDVRRRGKRKTKAMQKAVVQEGESMDMPGTVSTSYLARADSDATTLTPADSRSILSEPDSQQDEWAAPVGDEFGGSSEAVALPAINANGDSAEQCVVFVDKRQFFASGETLFEPIVGPAGEHLYTDGKQLYMATLRNDVSSVRLRGAIVFAVALRRIPARRHRVIDFFPPWLSDPQFLDARLQIMLCARSVSASRGKVQAAMARSAKLALVTIRSVCSSDPDAAIR
eukprot:CAMPEP_0117526518 /NCGR_PEP_ID=MMETSP0784-20121206/36326_1 /TAXON_ID=39447 /ORGANISM="" /LENGTH=371 /DNA_ID=CAMNT_0005322747 /DNA_START=27 /DNA_END=1138 /DNA_ORIENTATION=-